MSDDEALDAVEAAALESFMGPPPDTVDGVYTVQTLEEKYSTMQLSAAVGVPQMSFVKPGLWSTNVYKVLKQVHPDMGISKRAMSIMSDIVTDLVRRMYKPMVTLAKSAARASFAPSDVSAACDLVLRGELAKHAKSEIQRALTKAGTNKKSDHARLDSSEAGLVFSRITTKRVLLSCAMTPPPTEDGLGTALTAVLEYMTAEILELSGNAARDNKRSRIVPRHINLAIQNDMELEGIFRQASVSNGGVLPRIHAVLLPKKRR